MKSNLSKSSMTRRGSIFTLGVPVSIGLIVALLLFTFGLSETTFPRGGSVAAFDETITTFAADCTNPQPLNSWNLGGTACAKVLGAPEDRRIAWVAPDGSVADVTDFFSGAASDTYTIPTGSDPLAQVGTWTVQSIDPNGAAFAEAEFVVRDPLNASADLAVSNFGPFQTSAGNSISYRIELTNKGPDAASDVSLVSAVPAGTKFVSETQNSGPQFTCTNPVANSPTGNIECEIATLGANETAVFTLVFMEDGGTVITSVATVSSATTELHVADNSASASTTIVSGATGCTISCPSVAPVTTSACSAVVTYGSPSISGNCGTNPEEGGASVVCNPPSGSTFPIGSTAVSCTAPSGDTCSFNVSVTFSGGGAAPTITCPANQTFTGDVSAGTAVVTYPNPTTTGNCLTVVCSPPSGSVFTTGTTPVTCTATDPANNSDTCSFTVTVVSGDGCTLSCPGDITQTATGSDCSAVVTYTAPTTSGDCGTVTCTPASGSTFLVGTTVVSCVGTGADCDFTVNVIGSSAPTITTCATNKTVSVNSVCEGAIPNLLNEVATTGCSVTKSQSPAAGSLVPPGTYSVVITAENNAGVATCTATVTVVDATAPTVSCPAGTTVTADSSCAVVPNVIPGVTASDNCTPFELLTITQSPAAGTTVGSGVNTITVTVRDEAGNTSTCTTTFTVNDVTPPTITCPANQIRSNDPGACGAVVTYPNPTASDNCAGVTTACTPPSGSTFQVGTSAVSCVATDAAGNTSPTCSFTVTVNDAEMPTITCPANVSSTLPSNTTATAMAVTYSAPTVSDNCPGATATCVPASGSTFSVGTTTVTCTATDAAGNTATCSFNVTVLYSFTGFFSPVDNPPVINTVNAGRAIPVKFSLSGNKGLNIMFPGNPTYPVSGVIACNSNDPPSEIEETVTAGNSSLEYDATNDQYKYIWKTESSWAGQCRQLIIKLNDGTTHVANFKFR